MSAFQALKSRRDDITIDIVTKLKAQPRRGDIS